MSRVITFSRTYPSYHKRAGQPTYFVEQILNSLECVKSTNDLLPGVKEIVNDFFLLDGEHKKHHTMRAGHRWKAGDWFKPVVWQLPGGRFTKGNKQIQFAPEIQIKKVWDFDAEGTDFYLSGKHELVNPEGFDFSEVEKNDGLPPGDLFDWICGSTDFKKTNRFTGQIISWNENINY
jgi:hypothetical protein